MADRAGAWAGLGLRCFSSGSIDKGLENYRQAIRLDSSYGDVNYLRLVRPMEHSVTEGCCFNFASPGDTTDDLCRNSGLWMKPA